MKSEKIINLLLNQNDKRKKSITAPYGECYRIQAEWRIDTEYSIEFPCGEIYIDRLFIKKNAFDKQLLIGEHHTKFGVERYNIISIAEESWKTLSKLLK